MRTSTPIARPRRSGIILLVVLAMLGLFSLLAVSYVVFTSRARTTSAKLGNRERYKDPSEELMQRGEMQVLRGAQGPESALWGHDFLGDYYGVRDSITGTIRDAVNLLPLDPVPSSPAPSPNSVFLSSNEKQFPASTGQCFSYLDGQFLRIPTNLADRDPTNPLFGSNPDATRRWPTDDLGNGRILTMTEGPLKNVSFEIVRSFGNMGNAKAQSGLTGAVILDLTPHLMDVIAFDNETKTIEEWVRSGEILSLFYKPDDDANKNNDFWGNSSNNTNTRAFAGAPGSDDAGYALIVSGLPQNGFGLGVTGPSPIALNATVDVSDTPGSTGGSVRNVAVAYQGNYASYRSKGQGLPDGDTDEPSDAPDLQNMFLGYFPVDDELGATAPSYVRPALINYLMNELQEEITSLDPTGTNAAQDTVKLQSVIRMLQRCTLRPLPILNDPIPRSTAASGAQKFQYGNFSGGNASLSGAVNYNVPNPASLLALARTLATGPWDVDNDGDGIADSVWVDAGLPLVTMPDGKVVKPMLAVRIEDLGGRIDLNAAGSLAYFGTQGVTPQQAGPASGGVNASGGLARPLNAGVGTGPVESYNISAFRGLGYGPADLTFASLFVSSPAAGRSLILQRYGAERRDVAPGRSDSVSVSATGNDTLGYFRDASRPQYHGLTTTGGLISRNAPLDAWGKTKVVLDIYGQPMIANASTQFVDTFNNGTAIYDETTNDPYEFVSSALGMPDDAFTLEEFESILRRFDPSNSMLNSRLVQLLNAEINAEAAALGTNAAWKKKFLDLASQVTVRSRSLATPSGVIPAEQRANVNSTANVAWSNIAGGRQVGELGHPHRFVPIRQFQRAFESAGNGALDDWLRFSQVIAPEIRLGRRLNLNRPFGNETDDNSNGAIDDSGEGNPTNLVTLRTQGSAPSLTTNKVLQAADLTPEQLPMQASLSLHGNDARQLYARHLFSLMMFATRDHASKDQLDMPSVDPGVTAAQAAQLMHRKLAQWAVNAADFRDPDAIMTGFEYDGNPFDGWDVDGDLSTDETTTNPTLERGVVWGMESPSLLLTESIAVHDRKVRDTSEDSSGKKAKPGAGQRFSNMDDDLDQYRIPQAALYLELFHARSPAFFENPNSVSNTRANPWGASPDIYTTVTEGSSNQYRAIALDLDKLAPDNNPVWRVGISYAHNFDHPNGAAADPNPNAAKSSPLNLVTGAHGVTTARDAFTGQPDRLDIKANAMTNFRFDRVIWLSSQFATNGLVPTSIANLPTDTIPETVFYNRFRSTDYGVQGMKLKGGQYAVIGPRSPLSASAVPPGASQPFPFGSQVNAGSTPLPFNNPVNSPQQITLAPNAIQVTDTGGTLKTPSYGTGSPISGAEIRPVIGIGASARPPSDWSSYGNAAETEVGINVSAPVPVAGQFYSEPTQTLDAGYPIDSYYNYSSMAGQLPDEPFDLRGYAPLANDFNDGQRTGTRDDYKTAYLQRLADPTRPYDRLQNPYITVDWITIDLTVFNGEDQNTEETDSDTPPVTRWVDVHDPDSFGTAPDEYFGTRYKSGQLTQKIEGGPLAQQANVANLFSYHTVKPTVKTVSTGAALYFPLNLSHDADINSGGVATNHSTTLGYLNHSFGRRWGQLVPPMGTEIDMAYIGAPYEKQFPWMVWLDRPYANPYELTLVPFTNAASLGIESSFPSQTSAQYANNRASSPVTPFPPPGVAKPFHGPDPWNYRSDYQHLLNFFSADMDFKKSPNYGRLLDWVETPEGFDESQSMILAERFPTRPMNIMPTGTINNGWNRTELGTLTDPDYATQWNIDMPMETLRYPFNMIPSRVRRGLVNLNTLNGNRVYRELMGGASYANELGVPTSQTDAKGAFWNDFIISRRGYDLQNLTVSNTFPYRFDGRFDPAFPTEYAGIFTPGAVADVAPPVRGTAGRPVWPQNVAANQLSRTSIQSGLLRQTPQLTSKNAAQVERPLFERDPADFTVAQNHQHRDLSAFHRYQAMTRLANLTTGQSNVFAMWTTLGYFEVDVDNMSVGQEYGFDEGNNRRHRSFMIIDRSIPVRYEMGEDHNAADVILLRRKLN